MQTGNNDIVSYIEKNVEFSAPQLARHIAKKYNIEEIAQVTGMLKGLKFYFEEQALVRKAEKYNDILLHLALEKRDLFRKTSKPGVKTPFGQQPPYKEFETERKYLSKITSSEHLTEMIENAKEKFETQLVSLFDVYKVSNPAGKSSGIYEVYTPPALIERVRLALGGKIDLDPCSTALANKTVKAKRFFTKQDNALEQDWKCDSLFMNPPFASGLIREFIEYLKSNMKMIKQGIVLCNNMCEAFWYQLLLIICDCVCFLNKRIKFYTEDIREVQLMWGQSIFYLGKEVGRFKRVFSDCGVCVSLNG